jgi:hypothetical protein
LPAPNAARDFSPIWSSVTPLSCEAAPTGHRMVGATDQASRKIPQDDKGLSARVKTRRERRGRYFWIQVFQASSILA